MYKMMIPLIFCLTACTMAQPIDSLTLPCPSIIQGTVIAVEDAETFIIEDKTGHIEVEWEGEDIAPNLQVGEAITVAGVVDEDESIGENEIFATEFDAYCMKRASGQLLKAVPTCPLN